jgi:hypothetical protein
MRSIGNKHSCSFTHTAACCGLFFSHWWKPAVGWTTTLNNRTTINNKIHDSSPFSIEKNIPYKDTMMEKK